MPAEFIEPVHGRTDIEFPQLEMYRETLEGVPPVELPQRYTIRTYRPGDEVAWASIMVEAFNPHWDMERFRRFVLPHFAFMPDRLFFLCHRGDPVGSAMAFQWPGLPRTTGFVYMLAVKKDHCGMALGLPLTVACLRRFRDEGIFADAALNTESFRLPAIKHYLRLGFRPRLLVERHREMWMNTFEKIGMPELIEDFGIEKEEVMPSWRMAMRTYSVVSYTYWLSIRSMLGL